MLPWQPLAIWMSAATAIHGPVPISDEFRVNETVGRPELFPTICSDARGRFLVSWEQDQDIYARAFDANGASLDSPALLSGPQSAASRGPSCDLNSAGDGAVVWAGGLPKTVAMKRITDARYIEAGTIG